MLYFNLLSSDITIEDTNSKYDIFSENLIHTWTQTF